jgi:hypothetical protein
MKATMAKRPESSTSLPPSATLFLLCAIMVGCRTTPTQLIVVNYLGSGEVERFGETFEEAYYDRDAQGNVDIVLRRASRNTQTPADKITQIVHLKTIWRSIPGRTVAHRTQLNGTVTYCIVGPSIAATFEGAGSIFYKQEKRSGELIGSIDLARLSPVRRIGDHEPLFDHAELSGTFRAKHDPLRVVTAVNEINRVFGPERTADVAASRPGSGM